MTNDIGMVKGTGNRTRLSVSQHVDFWASISMTEIEDFNRKNSE